MDEKIYEKGMKQELKDINYTEDDAGRLLYELYNGTGNYSEEDIIKAIVFYKYKSEILDKRSDK